MQRSRSAEVQVSHSGHHAQAVVSHFPAYSDSDFAPQAEPSVSPLELLVRQRTGDLAVLVTQRHGHLYRH